MTAPRPACSASDKAAHLAAIEKECRAKGLNLTPIRRRVLEILLQDHRAKGAYDVLGVLRAEGLGSQPPAAYRALDFLVTNGYAHRIENLNAYVACSHSHSHHSPAFMICTSCNHVDETSSTLVASALADAIGDTGFQANQTTIEVQGLCDKCQPTP